MLCQIVHVYNHTIINKLRKLSHPNIISFLAYAVSDEDIVLVTNYVSGKNLEKLLFGKKSQQVCNIYTVL